MIVRRRGRPARRPACVPPEPSATTTVSMWSIPASWSCDAISSAASSVRDRAERRRAADRDRVPASRRRGAVRPRPPRSRARARSSSSAPASSSRSVVKCRVAPNSWSSSRFAVLRSRGGPPSTRWQSSPSRLAAAAVIRAWLLCTPPPVTSVSQPCSTASAQRSVELAGLVAAEREAGEVVALHEERGQPEVRTEARHRLERCRQRREGRRVTRRRHAAATRRVAPMASTVSRSDLHGAVA